jgi:hypothetical protein
MPGSWHDYRVRGTERRSPNLRCHAGEVLTVNRATSDQVEQLLEIAAGRRAAYADYQPGFWRPAADAIDRQRAYFTGLRPRWCDGRAP